MALEFPLSRGLDLPLTKALSNPLVTEETLTVAIAASEDDASESSGTVTLTGTTPNLGSSSATNGLRFILPIPQGATILEARIEFTPTESEASETVVRLTGEAADDAAQFTTAASSITNRADTTALVDWSLTNWVNGARHETPDLSEILQEIVDRVGFAGNGVVFFTFRQSGGTNKRFASFDHATLQEPTLTVTYT